MLFNIFIYTKGAFDLFCNVVKHITVLKNPAIRKVFYKQIYFTGLETLSMVAIIAILIGIVIITQVAMFSGLNAVLAGKILVWIVVREIGPLLVAIMVIMRSCNAVASELGSMKLNREMESLRIMGIAPLDYIIVPRLVGIVVSVFILTFYFQIFAITGGAVISSLIVGFSLIQHLEGIFSVLSLFDIGFSLLKSVVFGLLISTISCYHGYRVQSSITEIPQVTSIAVTHSFFLIFIFDGMTAIIMFL